MKLKRHQGKMLAVNYSANHDMFIFKNIKHDTISSHVCGDQNMYFFFFIIIFSKPSGLSLSFFYLSRFLSLFWFWSRFRPV